MPDEKRAVLRWRRGHQAAARRQRQLLAAGGPSPELAVAEALAALNALQAAGRRPGPREPVSEGAVRQVRRRWARVENRARQAKTR